MNNNNTSSDMMHSSNVSTNYSYSRAPTDKVDPIVSFSSADNAWRNEILSERDETFDVGYRADGDLGAFLSRPVKIFETDWQVNGQFSLRIDPWTIFLANPNVLKRIENFHLLRGDLDIKIMLNGNGFYYGRVLVDYSPLPDYRRFDQSPTFDREYTIQASQRPHVYLDPSTSTGGEMMVPFFFPKNWINLTTAQYDQLGRLTLTTLNPLKQANSGTGQVTISVFASMKNVQLTIPTVNPVGSITPQGGSEFVHSSYDGDEDTPLHIPYGIKPESGKTKASTSKGNKNQGSSKPSDEYGDGIISKPASIIAKAAGAITNVPVIGKYALASKFALEGIANVARIFGYSRPPIIDNITPAKIQSAGYLAYTDADEVVAKLSLDSKQELSIDPTTVGLDGTDQMALSHVLQKESLLTTFVWDEDAQEEDLLYNMHLSPAYFYSVGAWGTATGKASFTPMTHISQLFRYWRGSITVRFQIVASQFHKGRLRLTYDPTTTNVFSTESYNVAYNRIVDLAEDRDFEMTFRWSQDEGWKEVPQLFNASFSSFYSDTNSLLPRINESNGMFQVSVLNRLTTPNSAVDAPIQINVFVRAGDDFELAGPSSNYIRSYAYNTPLATNNRGQRIKPQSGVEEDVDCNEVTDNGASDALVNSPEVVDTLNAVGGDRILETDNTLYVFMGERIASLRQLMKRYNWHESIPITGQQTTLTYTRWHLMNFPQQRGYAANSNTYDVNGDPYNYKFMTYFNYILPAYAGWRGGIRRKYQVVTRDASASAGVIRQSGAILPSAQTQSSEIMATGSVSQHQQRYTRTGFAAEGGGYTCDGAVNPTAEIELPFYSQYRFGHTHNSETQTTDTHRPTAAFHTLEVLQDEQNTGSAAYAAYVRSSVAVGEDFSCFWYLNVPTIYSYNNPNASTS